MLGLPPGTFVDIHALTAGTWIQAINIPGLGRELLEGMTFSACPGFEAWLLASRRRLAGAAEGVLREAARAKLSSGDGARAVELASRLVATNPLDEDAQELLIRGYVASGDGAAAQIQRDACVALFRRELGTDPGVAVLHAADPEPQRHVSADRPATRTATLARLEAGLGALDAGAADAAISLLRQAVAEAEDVDDGPLQVQTRMALGSALVHSVRGRDGEGAGVLHEAIALADRIEGPESAALAHRELGYVDLLRGRYDRALRWLQVATTLAGDEPSERAWAFAVQGVVSTDVGHYAEALIAFQEARRLAGAEPLAQVHAWVWTFTGRLHLLRHDLEQAREFLTKGLDSARTLAGPRSCHYPRHCSPTSISRKERWTPHQPRMSTRMPWHFSSATRAGRASRLAGWVWSPRAGGTPRRPCTGSPKLAIDACACPTPICGWRATASMRSAHSPSTISAPRPRNGYTTWRR